MFVQKSILRQVDDAIKPPDAPFGQTIGMGNKICAAPDSGCDGNINLVSFPHSLGNFRCYVLVQLVQVVQVDQVVICKYWGFN
jgi:hypothetical protein